MRAAARNHALTTSWDHIFEGMFDAYQRCLLRSSVAAESALHAATT